MLSHIGRDHLCNNLQYPKWLKGDLVCVCVCDQNRSILDIKVILSLKGKIENKEQRNGYIVDWVKGF